MKVESIICHPSGISSTGHRIIAELSCQIDKGLAHLQMIGKAETLELEFYPPGEGMHPDFEIIGAPCFDLIITIIDAEDLQVEIPSNGYLLCVVFSLINEEQGSFVIDLDELVVFDGDLADVISTLAQEIVQLLTA